MLLELLLFFLLVFFILYMRDRKPKNMPPGPFEIPFVGGLPVESTGQLKAMKDKYGDIFCTRTGVVRTVTVCDFDLGKQVMARPEMSDRPNYFSLFKLNPEEVGGVTTSNGAQWVHDRRFVLRNLRDLGMGKTYLEVAIHQEAQALVDDIKAGEGKAMKHPQSFRTCVINIIWQMVASKRYEMRSKEINDIFKIFDEFRKVSIMIFVDAFFPFTAFLPGPIKRYVLSSHVLDAYIFNMKKMIGGVITEHEAALDLDNPRDMIDEYLIDMKAQQQNPDQDQMKTIGALYEIIGDIFGAASETTTNMLYWIIFYMAKFPQIKDQCRAEIDKVVPKGSLPSLEHKPDLPMVEAFVAETLRHSCMLVQNVERQTTHDTSIGGYFLPKGTLVVVATSIINMNPKHWEAPEEFNPARFLDEEKKFTLKAGPHFSFGSGRRACPGEPLARMELFLFAAALLKHFDISLPPGTTLNETAEDRLSFRTPNQDQMFIYKYVE